MIGMIIALQNVTIDNAIVDTLRAIEHHHPWSRLIVAYLVTFFNFLIFAEDPISHSQTEAHIIVVGNCFSFLFNKYPGLGWNILKVMCWILAIITGLLAGKFIFHRQLFGKSCAR
ncbi:hypothetical protein GOODEAATRI_003405 [Goodea atripinnis]|uniref:Uncharacterized protein n=1 Tax=Goodea atripinnis TaxID=208336 RepID=A0ABV0PB10_9TELE